MGRRNPKKNKSVKQLQSLKRSDGLYTKFIFPAAFLILTLSVLLAYSNSYDASFQFDDEPNLLEAPEYQNYDIYTKSDIWFDILERPVSHITLTWNWVNHGMDVVPYHIFNVIIHLLNVWLVFLFLLYILSFKSAANNHIRDNRHYIAFAVALIFALHPLQTQTVTYIVQRMTSMAAFFYILSLFAYVAGRQNHIKEKLNGRTILLYIAALLAFLFALKSKQSAISLPLMWIVMEFFLIRDKKGRLNKKLIYGALALFGFTMVIGLAADIIPRETQDYTRMEYFTTQFGVIMTYLGLLLIPASQNLDYDFQIVNNLFEPVFLLGLLINLAVIAFAVWIYKKDKIISFGIAFFYVALSVESSIMPIKDVIFEHRLYMPMIGFFLSLSAGLWYLAGKKSPYPALGVVAVLAIAYGFAAHARNEVWQTEYRLWEDTYEKSPNKARPVFNFGNENKETGNIREAEKLYLRALEIDPEHDDAMINLGGIYNSSNRSPQAIPMLEKAASIKNNKKAYNALGIAYRNVKEYEKAEQALLTAIKIDPAYYQAMTNLGTVYTSTNEFDKAIDILSRAINIKPDFEIAYIALGSAYNSAGNFKKGAEYLSRSLSMDPDNLPAIANLANAYNGMGKHQEAIETYQRGIKLNPNASILYANMGTAYSRINNFDKALESYNKAIKLNPRLHFVYKKMSDILIAAGKQDEAARIIHRGANNGDPYSKSMLAGG
ncbi:MAG: tetratricopeptide repeat protein [Candidatus Kapaibacterium sp.]